MYSTRLCGLSNACFRYQPIYARLTILQKSSGILVANRKMSSAEFPPPQLKSIADEVASLLRTRGETICVAETAAGGLISSAILSTPGASKIYKGGLTLYTLESRIAFAGWTQQDIDNYNGPTPDLVAGLATNVREKLKATYCVGEVRA